jgi:2-hydroxychromene-2-carboxylate isomerase
MPALKSGIARIATSALTSATLRNTSRRLFAWRRAISGGHAMLHYFHDPADPYSHLTAQKLPALARRYQIALQPHLVPAPAASAAPDAPRLAAWSRRDAAALARAYDLDFPENAGPPEADDVQHLAAVLAKALSAPNFAELASAGGTALWHGKMADFLSKTPAASEAETAAALASGEAERTKLRHYLGATFYFEGEWFWGIDRLHHLETRLAAQGLDLQQGAPHLAPVHDVTLSAPQGSATGRVLHVFLSFRSPYSYISLPRACALARHYGAALRLRFVLPMVMRGLPVPGAKRIYITLDTKREADRLGMSFGKIVDPVGAGVERGLAVLHHAIAAGHGEAFALSFLQGAFADGIDATTEAGLRRIAERAGLTAQQMHAALADDTWRDIAEANRAEMLQAGLWGVPCFRVDDGPMVWGQDRLWVVERQLSIGRL